jgi:hypothetical protein
MPNPWCAVDRRSMSHGWAAMALAAAAAAVLGPEARAARAAAMWPEAATAEPAAPAVTMDRFVVLALRFGA